MSSLSEIYNRMYFSYPRNDLPWFLSSVSRFHRIQGCNELEKAVDFVYRELLDTKNFEINMYRYSYDKNYGTYRNVIGWNVSDGFTELVSQSRTISSFSYSKTAIAGHSPKGDVEADVVYIGNGLNPNVYKDLSGKIVLSYGSPYLVYLAGCISGASGFIFFKKGIHEQAIPYIGLFLSREDIKICRAPATTISRENALRIINKLEKGDKVRARVYVEASFREEAYIPILEMALGDNDKEIHIYAHICHPAGTINDNASGVVSLLTLIHAIDRTINKNLLEIPKKKKLVFLLFPEYYGSLSYLINKAKYREIEFSINLDMVGENQIITNSTLHLIRSPSILSNPFYEAVIFKTILYSLSRSTTFSGGIKTLTYRFDTIPYDSGSDHDIYLQFGISSVMINQWPDLYYHSDMDTIDKFDPDIVTYITSAIGSAIYAIALELFKSKSMKRITDLYIDYTKSYLLLKLTDEEINVNHNSVDDNVAYKSVSCKGLVTTRYIANTLSIEKAIETMRSIENKFMYHIFSAYIPIIATLKSITIYDIRRYIALDYGYNIPVKDLKKILYYLETLGIITRI